MKSKYTLAKKSLPNRAQNHHHQRLTLRRLSFSRQCHQMKMMRLNWFKQISSSILQAKHTSCLQHWTWIWFRRRVKSLTVDYSSSGSKVLLPSKVTTLCISRHYRCQRWVSMNVKQEVGNLTAGSNSYVKIFSRTTETWATWLLSRNSFYRLFS